MSDPEKKTIMQFDEKSYRIVIPSFLLFATALSFLVGGMRAIVPNRWSGRPASFCSCVRPDCAMRELIQSSSFALSLLLLGCLVLLFPPGRRFFASVGRGVLSHELFHRKPEIIPLIIIALLFFASMVFHFMGFALMQT